MHFDTSIKSINDKGSEVNVVILKLLLLVTLNSFGDKISYEGRAVSLKTKAFMYKEVHLIETDEAGFNLKLHTDYVDAEGKIIARNSGDFTKNKYVPEVVFEDFRFKKSFIQTVDLALSQVTVMQKINNKEVGKKVIKMTKNMVSAQGFDNFLKANYSDLKSQKIDFLVIEKSDSYSFLVTSAQSADKGNSTFKLAIDSFFGSFFLKPIEVTYRDADKKLLSYSGLSNILDSNEKSQEVEIVYTDVIQ